LEKIAKRKKDVKIPFFSIFVENSFELKKEEEKIFVLEERLGRRK
jgi:hypothetical protein